MEEFRKIRIRRSGLERRLRGQERWLFLQRTHVQFPVPTWKLTTICNSSFRGYNTFWSPWALVMHVVPKHTLRQNIHVHKIKNQRRWLDKNQYLPHDTPAMRQALVMAKQAFLATLLDGVFFIYDYYIKVSQGKCNVYMGSRNLIKNEIAGLLTKKTSLGMRLNSPESSDWEKHSQDKCLSSIPTALCGTCFLGKERFLLLQKYSAALHHSSQSESQGRIHHQVLSTIRKKSYQATQQH